MTRDSCNGSCSLGETSCPPKGDSDNDSYCLVGISLRLKVDFCSDNCYLRGTSFLKWACPCSGRGGGTRNGPSVETPSYPFHLGGVSCVNCRSDGQSVRSGAHCEAHGGHCEPEVVGDCNVHL